MVFFLFLPSKFKPSVYLIRIKNWKVTKLMHLEFPHIIWSKMISLEKSLNEVFRPFHSKAVKLKSRQVVTSVPCCLGSFSSPVRCPFTAYLSSAAPNAKQKTVRYASLRPAHDTGKSKYS